MGSTCPICFDDLNDKIKASPNACDHIFCLPCIEKWSKLGSYCPVDRKRYRKIIKLDTDDVIQVKPRKRKRQRVVYDFTTNCDICSKDVNSETLLLCDCCDLGFHCQCLKPPLTDIPAGLWFCPSCVAIEEKLKKRKGITKEIEADIGYNNGVNHKQSPLKCDNAGSSSNKQTTNVVNAFHDILSVFHEIKQEKELEKNKLRSPDKSDLTFCGNEGDKILKTFSPLSETKKAEVSVQSNSEPSSPYSNKNVDITLNKLHQVKRSLRFEYKSDYKLSFRRRRKPDIYHKNYYEDNDLDFDLLYEQTEEKTDALKSDPQNNSYETSDKIGDGGEENIQASGILYEQTGVEVDAVIDNQASDVENSSLKTSDKIIEGKEKSQFEEFETVELLNDSESSSVSSCSQVSQPSLIKGTFPTIISDAYNNIISDKSLNQFSKNETFNLNPDKKMQFSVFERVDDIDALQKKYAEINTFAHSLLGSYTNLGNCSLCNDKIFIASQKFCKICKFNYSKKYSVILKRKRHLKSSNAVKDNNMPSNTHTLGREKIYRKSRMSASERRQHSLSHALKKIHRSKWKPAEFHS